MTHTNKAREYRAKINSIIQHVPDEIAVTEPTLYQLWTSEFTGPAGSIVRGSNDRLYRSIHPILVKGENTIDPTEDYANIKWQKLGNSDEEWPEWVNPLGIPANFYSSGEKVSHNSSHWVSTVNLNSWEPGQYGWEEQL